VGPVQSNPAATVAGHEPRRFIIAAADAGRRIDEVVAESLGLGRRGATRLLHDVRRNGRRVRKGDRLTVGDEILLPDLAAMALSERWAGTGPTPPPGSAPSNPAGGEDRGPAELAAPPVILRATASVLVVDKPSGLPSVAIAGRGGPSLASWAAATQPASAGRGGPGEHGLAHRLDTPTSGLVLIALTDQAYTSLRRQFTRREIEKTYLALVHGEIDEPFEIEAPIGQHRKSRRRMRTAEDPRTIERHAARPASTSIQPIEQFAGFSVVRATSRTGMRHQVRVHLSHAGHPLVGDDLYGGTPVAGIGAFLLHAGTLRWRDPDSGEVATDDAPEPARWAGVREALRKLR
jgi:23S rRNA pseudouridine1911/1915/1917 synthase